MLKSVILGAVAIGFGVWASRDKAAVDGESVLWHLVVLGTYWAAIIVVSLVVLSLRRKKRETRQRPTQET
ncbi:MAG: hypothetical protein QOJ66_80 [Ilumatobacteraceae bacterium]